MAAQALELSGVRLDEARSKVEETLGAVDEAPTGSPPFTHRAKKVLELSLRESLQLGHDYIGTEHILLGILREGEGVGAHVLASLGADHDAVRAQIQQLLGDEAVTAKRLKVARETGEPASSERVLSVGRSWTARVVRPGRGPGVFASAYDELVELAQLKDGEDEANIRITSVDTEQGPGISLTFTHYVDDSDVGDGGDDETP